MRRSLPPWYKISPRRLSLERSVLKDIPYFSLEGEAFDSQKRLIVIGNLNHTLERSGKIENFRVRLVYPDEFPRRIQSVFDHDKRFNIGADGHLIRDYQLCLTLPERKEFSLGSDRLTEEVLGATLVWFDKRLIYERSGKWPGPAERHGALAKIDLILERAGLKENPPVWEWTLKLYDSLLKDGRYQTLDVYAPCPCESGGKLKFCHGEQLRLLFKLLKELALSGTPLENKESS